MTKHVPVIHSSEPTRPLTPRKPVDPVRRCCSQLRQPNPTTLKTAKSASAKSAAVVVRISGSPSVRSVVMNRCGGWLAGPHRSRRRPVRSRRHRTPKLPAHPQRRPAAMRAVARPANLGCAANSQQGPRQIRRGAGGIHWRYRWGGYLEHPVRADVPGTAHTQGDHEMCWWRRPVVCLMLVGDHHVGDSGQVLQGASILAGWGGVDHDNRIGRLGCPRGCQRGCNRNLQLGQQYIAVGDGRGYRSQMCIGTRRHQHGVLGAGIDHDNRRPARSGHRDGPVQSNGVARRWARSWAAAGSSPNAPENCTCAPARAAATAWLAPFPPGVRVNDAASTVSPGRGSASTTNVRSMFTLPTTHTRGAMGPTLVSLAFAMLAVG